MAEAQQPQITPEMLKKLQGEEEKKKENTVSSKGSKHWIVKCGKDIFYISFQHFIILKDFLRWLYANRSKNEKLKQLVNVIKNNNGNKDRNITLEELAIPPTDDILSLDENRSEIANQIRNATNQFQYNNLDANIVNNCDNNEQPLSSPITRRIGL